MTNKKTFNINKYENFSEWYSGILNKAEVTDLRYGVKGFVVIRPWGAKIMEKMYRIYESALKCTGHDPSFFPTVIPEANFKKEAGHVEGFAPEVFWLENKQGEDKLALRPTSETAFYEMYNLWVRSYRDLPLKIYQRANIFRYETKATRPLIRSREFHWLEAHDCFATEKEAHQQVQEDIKMTEEVMHKIFGIPFLPMKRPEWDKFPGADYTVGSDCILPDGKVIQQPSTHMLGTHFSKAFNIKYIDRKEKEKYVYQTCYGPAISRIMASVLATHGDNKGLILPYTLAPIQVVIIPFHSKSADDKIKKTMLDIQTKLIKEYIDVKIDDSNKRPGDKFFFWEMKGVPFRIEIGEKELEKNSVTIFIRDIKEKVEIPLKNLSEEIKNMGAEYDERLLEKSDEFFNNKVVDCNNKDSIKKALANKKIARFSFCSANKEGASCAEFIEKELQARVMGTYASKEEKPKGKCPVCNKDTTVVVYAGKSY